MDPSIYDLFDTDDDTLARQRAAALARVLRNDEDAGMLAAISGAKGMQPFAQMAGQSARQKEQLLAEAGGQRLRLTMQGREHAEAARARAAEREEDRAWRSQENALNRAAMRERAGMPRPLMGRPSVKQLDDGSLVVVDPNTGDAFPVNDTRTGGQAQGQDRGFDMDLQKLGADLQFVTRMPQDLATLEGYAGKTKPGVGPIRGRLPEWAISNEGVGLRKAVGRLLNAQIYMTTGKQINEAETERMAEAWLSKHGTDSSIDQGVRDLKAQMEQAARNFYAKYDDRVLSEFGARGGYEGMGSFAPGKLGARGRRPAPARAAPAAGGFNVNDPLGLGL